MKKFLQRAFLAAILAPGAYVLPANAATDEDQPITLKQARAIFDGTRNYSPGNAEFEQTSVSVVKVNADATVTLKVIGPKRGGLVPGIAVANLHAKTFIITFGNGDRFVGLLSKHNDDISFPKATPSGTHCAK